MIFVGPPRPVCYCPTKIIQNSRIFASLFQDSDRTSSSTEINNTSYESPIIQLFGARSMRAGHHQWGATPTSHKTVYSFSFWGRGGQEGWFFEKKKILIWSNVLISWMHRYLFYDIKVHFWWPNKRFFWCRSSWNTLYFRISWILMERPWNRFFWFLRLSART